MAMSLASITNGTCPRVSLIGGLLRGNCRLEDPTYMLKFLPSCSSAVVARYISHFSIMLLTSVRLLLFPSIAVGVISAQSYKSDAELALSTLQKWYNKTTGTYDTTGWWNSANCITVLGDLAAADPSSTFNVSSLFANTWVAAQNYDFQMNKVVGPNFLPHSFYGSSPHGEAPATTLSPTGFLNGYYDDEGWWALGWIQAYDVTKDTKYLETAVTIFQDMKKGATTPCSVGTSGIWWDRNHTYVNAIANELYLSVGSHLANRMSNKQYYLDIALNQWAWFQESGMINSHNLINDGLQHCRNNGGTVWSYNQGVILGALVELNQASPNATYLETAKTIAMAAITNLSDSNNVLHDPCEPNCGADGSQFKGIFMRNLQKLHVAAPEAGFLKSISTNAASIWSRNRNSANELSVVWSGPFVSPANASTQSSAMDALVAAISFQISLGNAIAS